MFVLFIFPGLMHAMEKAHVWHAVEKPETYIPQRERQLLPVSVPQNVTLPTVSTSQIQFAQPAEGLPLPRWRMPAFQVAQQQITAIHESPQELGLRVLYLLKYLYARGDNVSPREIKMIKNRIDQGADLNVVYRQGERVLYFALETNNTEIVRLLLDSGAWINEEHDRPALVEYLETCRFLDEERKISIIKMLMEKEELTLIKLEFLIEDNQQHL